MDEFDDLRRRAGILREAYNGWSNRPTWNVSLWLNNDEPLYRLKEKLKARFPDPQQFAMALEEFCRDKWGQTDRTPDGDALRNVNWAEIAQNELEEQ